MDDCCSGTGRFGVDGLTSAAEENEEASSERQRSQVLLHHESSSCITVDHERVDG